MTVPRHKFVPEEYKKDAYRDTPLPIGEGQTISQPSLVATMVEALKLKGDERVLEVGTGSGYEAAVLSKLAKEVYTVEIVKKLAHKARAVLKKLGYQNVYVQVGDGSRGLVKYAPFQAIIVSAAAEKTPPALVKQLKEGGRIVIPLAKGSYGQELKAGVKKKGKLSLYTLEQVRFVPLVGKAKIVK